MTTIGFLHTSPVHVPTFERLVAALAPEAGSKHVVDEQLLAQASMAGVADRADLGIPVLSSSRLAVGSALT